MSSIDDLQKVSFNEYDKYGNYIQAKEPLQNILFERVSVLAHSFNTHLENVKIIRDEMMNNMLNTTGTLNALEQTVRRELKELKEENAKLKNIVKILSIKAAELIDAEGVKNLLKMQASSDPENHVMAEEIIIKHLSTLEITFNKTEENGQNGN